MDHLRVTIKYFNRKDEADIFIRETSHNHPMLALGVALEDMKRERLGDRALDTTEDIYAVEMKTE